MLVQAFVLLHLDYCNSLLYGVTDRLMQRVQSVQNAAARLVTGAHQSDHITPVLRQLHCQGHRVGLPVFDWPSLEAPVYLADKCHLVSHLMVTSCVLPTF